MKSERGKTYISSGLLLPSKVTHLVIKRPAHFQFRPGDYVFVNIPAIALYEWHPFTISSAPELEDYVWLHIRAVGEWTNRLYDYFEAEQERLHNGEVPPLTDRSQHNQSIVQDGGPLKRLQSSLKRGFSGRRPVTIGACADSGDAKLVGYTRDKEQPVSVSEGELHNRTTATSNGMFIYFILIKNL